VHQLHHELPNEAQAMDRSKQQGRSNGSHDAGENTEPRTGREADR
jgi:hypothetical protein